MSNQQSPTYFNAEAVRSVLRWPMVNEAVEAALKAVVANAQEQIGDDGKQTYVSQPPRNFTKIGEDTGKLLLTMPAYVGNYRLTGAGGADAAKVSTLACKLVTSFRGNNQLDPPLPNIVANILLFNAQTGELDAIMAGTDITTWRTVSASLVATKHLYFRRFGPRAEQERDINVAIIGCGVQGRMHALGMCANFRVKQLTLYNRTEARAQELQQELRESFGAQDSNAFLVQPQIQVCSTPREALGQADVICVATYSSDALVTADSLSHKRPIHINGENPLRFLSLISNLTLSSSSLAAVGAGEVHFGEVSEDIYRQSVVYVDCMSNAENELKGLPQPLAMHELGSLIIDGNYPGQDALTIFQSMGTGSNCLKLVSSVSISLPLSFAGMASEDACVAEAVQKALKANAK